MEGSEDLTKTNTVEGNSANNPAEGQEDILKLKKEFLSLIKKNEELSAKIAEMEASKLDTPSVQNSGELTVLKEELANLKGIIAGMGHVAPTITGGMDPLRVKWANRKPTHKDIQDTYVTFSARAVAYVITAYSKNNVLYEAPFKAIEFKYAGSDIRKNGRESEVVNFCTYSTNLKEEIEFIRNSPLYGVEFSENLNKIVSEDAKMLNRMSSTLARLRTLSLEHLIPMAKNEGLDVNNMGNDDIALELAIRISNRELSMERELTQKRMAENIASLQRTHHD